MTATATSESRPPAANLSLPSYAAVKAATAEGFPLIEVLALEKIEPPDWTIAETTWKVRLATDKAELSRYTTELASAEDWLHREVTPLSSDLPVWLAFLDAYGAAQPKAFEWLTHLNLGINDLSRIGRSWTRRMNEDASITKRIADLRRRPLAPLPPLVVPAPVRRRSRSSKMAEESTVKPRVPLIKTVRTADLGLDRYAAIHAQIEVGGPDLKQRLLRFGIASDADRATLDARWRREFDRDPTLKRDFKTLVAHETQRLVARARAAPPLKGAELPSVQAPVLVQSRPRLALEGTSLALDVPRLPALPFIKRMDQGTALAVSARRPVRPSRPIPTGTMLSVDAVPKGVLPFPSLAPKEPPPAPPPVSPAAAVRSPKPPRAAPPRSANPLAGGTVMAIEGPHGPPMPFVAPSDAPPVSLAGSSPPCPRSPLAATVMLRDALPLPSPTPATPTAPRPPPPAPPPPQAAPSLTLEQHASLSVELAVLPHQAAGILARYHITHEQKTAVDLYYRERMALAPELQSVWQATFSTYHAWVTKPKG